MFPNQEVVMEGKMDLRIQKTYLALHNTFTQLLEEKRFEDLTVNELCERAMIRRTTFYKHFADKYEYFYFYLKEIVMTIRDNLTPDVMEGNVREYLNHMCRELVRFVKEHDRLVQNIKMSSMFPVLLGIVLDLTTWDVAQVLRRTGEYGSDKAYLEGTANFIAGGLTNTLFQMLKQDSGIDEECFIGIITSFLENR